MQMATSFAGSATMAARCWRTSIRLVARSESVAVAAHALQLAPLLPWLALAPQMKPVLARWLGSGHPRGQLDEVRLRWSKIDGLRALALSFSGLGIDPGGKLPGVDHLRGTLRGDGAASRCFFPYRHSRYVRRSSSVSRLCLPNCQVRSLSGSSRAIGTSEPRTWYLPVRAMPADRAGTSGYRPPGAHPLSSFTPPSTMPACRRRSRYCR